MGGINLDFSTIANSGFMYTLGAAVALFITLLSVAFLAKAWRAGISKGIDRAVMRKVIRSSAVFTIVPSIAILLGLITMAGGLGVPLPWMRLSVIGSVQYELIAADSAARAAGLPELLLRNMTPEVFASIAIVMTICILAGPLFNIFFLKGYLGKVKNMQQKDNTWGKLVVASLFMGMICTFLGNPIITIRQAPRAGWIAMLVMVVAAAVYAICDYLVQNKKQKWLDGFMLPISMIAGMVTAGFIG